MTDGLDVVYLAGIYRSGTTVLSNILGQLPGFFCGGELMALWKNLLDDRARCGCGSLLPECPLWAEILAKACDDEKDLRGTAAEMVRCQRALFGTAHTWMRLPGLLRRRTGSPNHDDDLAAYRDQMGRLYEAIAAVSGARVIVDSSKEAANGAALRDIPGLRATFVHVVRDPRGTVYSSLRDEEGAEVDRSRWRRSGYTALSWVAGNLAVGALLGTVARSRRRRVRYEEYVADIGSVLRGLAGMVGEEPRLPLVGPATVLMRTTHTVSGNDNRFRTGPVTLRPDLSWRRHLHRVDAALVTAACAPLMGWYGYLGRRHG